MEKTIDDKKEKVLELVKEQQMDKKDQALYDIEQIKMNTNNILKFTQVQLTKVLMDLSDTEKEIEGEIEQYWMKDLPIRKLVQLYVKHTGALINIYTQEEDVFKKAFENIATAIDYPNWDKIEAGYVEIIEDYKEKLRLMQNEFRKLKDDMEELQEEENKKLEEKYKAELKREISKVHLEYTAAFKEADEKLDAKNALIGKLKAEIEKKDALVTKLESEKKILEDDPPESSDIKKSDEVDGSVYIPPEEPSKEDSDEEDETVTEKIEKLEKTDDDDSSKKIEEKSDEKRFPPPPGGGRGAVTPPVETQVCHLIIKETLEGTTKAQIRKKVAKVYSMSSFYKYWTWLIDEEIIEEHESKSFMKPAKVHPDKIPKDMFTAGQLALLFPEEVKDAKEEKD